MKLLEFLFTASNTGQMIVPLIGDIYISLIKNRFSFHFEFTNLRWSLLVKNKA